MFDYVPLEEEARIHQEISGKGLAIIFDGMSRLHGRSCGCCDSICELHDPSSQRRKIRLVKRLSTNNVSPQMHYSGHTICQKR